MGNHAYARLWPAEPLTALEQKRLICEAWMNLSNSGDAGATSWDVLDAIQAKVTDSLYSNPPDLASAASWTSRAFLLREGGEY